MDEGAWAQAIPILEKLVERASGYSTARKFLGMAYVEAGRYDEARSMLERSVELAPADEGAARELCELYKRLGERESAHSIAAHLSRLSPFDEDLADLLDQLRVDAPAVPEIGNELAEDADRWIAAGARAVEEILGAGPNTRSDGSVATVPRLTASGDPPAGDANMVPLPPRLDPAPTPTTPVETPPAAPPGSLDAQLASSAGAPIETLTMADIYVEQGLYRQAMRIYQRQAELRPQDGSVTERIRRLEERIKEEGTDSSSLASSPDPGA